MKTNKIIAIPDKKLRILQSSKSLKIVELSKTLEVGTTIEFKCEKPEEIRTLEGYRFGIKIVNYRLTPKVFLWSTRNSNGYLTRLK